MKVIYPGPAVEGAARREPQWFGAHNLELRPGENVVPADAGKALVGAGIARPPEAKKPVPPKQAAPKPADAKKKG